MKRLTAAVRYGIRRPAMLNFNLSEMVLENPVEIW